MSVADKLHQRQMALRKKSGLPHPDYYKELGHSYNISDDKERLAKQSEIKKKYKVEEVEQLDELSKDTLKSYIGKATKDMAERKRQQDIATRRSEQPRLQGKYGQKSSMRTAEAHAAAAKSRAVGIGKAAIKFAEETEQLDEMPESSMKTRDVHAHLKKSGWALKRTGGGHDVYAHPKSDKHIAVPRHKQLKAPLIRGIMKASRVSEETEIEEQLEKKGRFVSGPPKKTFKAPTIVSPIKEAKDPREYDYEGDMAMSQLRSLVFNAEDLMEMMDETTNLPEWVQSKITLAEDYISTAANYLRGELTEAANPAQQAAIAVNMKKKGVKPKDTKEEVEIDEGMENGVYIRRDIHGRAIPSKPTLSFKKFAVKSDGTQGKELKVGTLTPYTDKEKRERELEQQRSGHMPLDDYKAHMKKYGHLYKNEEVEIDEAAKWRSTSVAKKVTDPDDESSRSYDYHHENPRSTGMKQATSDKPYSYGSLMARPEAQVASQGARKGMITKQHAARLKDRIKSAMRKEEVELSEGRPSQRHPLEGHEYHKKTNAELEYIAKDAHKAAEAMKGHNTTAENKYRDQANDSATVRYFRQKSGMPDWYKKKYGHVKEEVEYLEEKNEPTNPALWSKAKSLARSKFDVYPSAYANGWAAKWYKSKGGGWKTVSEDVDEPSAAARTLSRKAQIVRDAAKGKKQEQEEASDKFQKDPELSSDMQKT